MLKQIVTYRPISPLRAFKGWIAFCLMIFLLAKPIVFIPLGLVGAKYEFFDLQEKENSSEKEIVPEYEIKYFSSFRDLFSQEYQRRLVSRRYIQLALLNLTTDIPLPPPKL